MKHAAVCYTNEFIKSLAFVSTDKHIIEPTPIALDTFLKKAIRFSKNKGLALVNETFNLKLKSDTNIVLQHHKEVFFNGFETKPGYNFILGSIGEILSMVWLYVFAYKYNLANVEDTSEDRYTRGFDFIGTYTNSPTKLLVQVKFFSNQFKILTENKMSTFLDEMNKNKCSGIIMVPSSKFLSRSEGLSFRNQFNKRKDIIYISGPNMSEEIRKWVHPDFGRGAAGFWNFFQKAVTEMHYNKEYSPNLTKRVHYPECVL